MKMLNLGQIRVSPLTSTWNRGHCTKHETSAGRGNVGNTNTATRVQYRSFWFEQSVSAIANLQSALLDDSGTTATSVI